VDAEKQSKIDFVKEFQKAVWEDNGVKLNYEDASEGLKGLVEFVLCFETGSMEDIEND
jgi:hypothetical protein